MFYVLISLVLSFGIIGLIHYANNYEFIGITIYVPEGSETVNY